MDEPGVGRGKGGGRTFSLEYKLAFLREWDEAAKAGSTGLLLRERGLARSTVDRWLDARAEGRFAESMEKAAKGPSLKETSLLRAEAASWKRRAEEAERKLAQAEAAQEILGKAFELLEGATNSSTAEPASIPPALMSAEEYRMYLQRLQLS